MRPTENIITHLEKRICTNQDRIRELDDELALLRQQLIEIETTPTLEERQVEVLRHTITALEKRIKRFIRHLELANDRLYAQKEILEKQLFESHK